MCSPQYFLELPLPDTALVLYSGALSKPRAASQRPSVAVRGRVYNPPVDNEDLELEREYSSGDQSVSLAEDYLALHTYRPLLTIDGPPCLDPMQYAARLLMQFELIGIFISVLFLVVDMVEAFDVLGWGCHALGK
jgi:hypothetical protein